MALMIGVLGFALGSGGANTALRSAQGTLGSVLSAARSQAALSQSRTTVFVDADPTGDGFLRTLHIAVETSTDSWSFVSDSVNLPVGVGLVPASSAQFTGVTFATGWAAKRYSALGASRTFMPTGMPAAGTYVPLTFAFNADGTIALLADSTQTAITDQRLKLILAPLRRTAATTLCFDQPQALRGVLLSAYGKSIPIDDATGFDNDN